MKVCFHEIDKTNHKLKYVVICARYKNQWIFVKHKDRNTWEVPGGHIEQNELADEAARRELQEETGAIIFQIALIGDYSVESSEGISYGRLYFAEVQAFGDSLAYEMTERILKDNMPEELTYKEIQPLLMKKVIEEVSRKELNICQGGEKWIF
jgi:8-oxo-dGTP diphosphatase